MLRGEIWLVNLDPTVGSEIKKTRPAIIISPKEMQYLNTVIVAPLTSGSKPAPFRVAIHFQDKDGFILLDQIRTLDKKRLLKKIGKIESEKEQEIMTVLQEIFLV